MISRSWKYLLGGRGGNNDDFDDHEYDDNLDRGHGNNDFDDHDYDDHLDGEVAFMMILKIMIWWLLGNHDEGNNNAFDDDYDEYDDHLDGEVAIMILMIMTMIITWTERWQ